MDKITTLIVEDEPLLAEILVDTLKQLQAFDVIGVADKQESAKKLIRLYQPQLILLDNFLPDGKGIDLIRHTVNTSYSGRIIFITADNHMDTISEALRLGVFDYLIKPVHYQRLQHTLQRFSRYRSSLRSSEQASQTHVDALFNIQAKEENIAPEATMRGIDETTLQRVRQCFSEPEVVHTADSLSRLLGSSKTTARRYLEQGVKDNFLEAEIVYGKVGRPERIYRGK
ncbi:citrate response regulator transcription factor CitB [Escherichia fergusonii]|uniref:citrate response regulator transcription factor CitB n=1 Tax=Escherichia fergusonii TaxID=564 RepID=UPI0006148EB0|nr:response regulator [Escherichia fergusonii]KWV97736.1 two-component response regulator DpiA [Escherichia fergusonii]MCP9657389.1 response regulator [Escherichia fergusonii]NMW27614.1 response regulator [Escherichia fergusonii]QMF36455.1 response regulator [Escherichia fergusonii]QML20959.1 response regulator [Escherichia fergusonii]